MSSRENRLREDTFKNQVDTLAQRVYYTITNNKRDPGHRTAQALAMLIQVLNEKSLLTDREIDDLLMRCLD